MGSMTPPGWDTIPSWVSFQQMLLLELPTLEQWKAELIKAEKKVTQIFKYWQVQDRTCGPKAEFLQLHQHCPPTDIHSI